MDRKDSVFCKRDKIANDHNIGKIGTLYSLIQQRLKCPSNLSKTAPLSLIFFPPWKPRRRKETQTWVTGGPWSAKAKRSGRKKDTIFSSLSPQGTWDQRRSDAGIENVDRPSRRMAAHTTREKGTTPLHNLRGGRGEWTLRVPRAVTSLSRLQLETSPFCMQVLHILAFLASSLITNDKLQIHLFILFY